MSAGNIGTGMPLEHLSMHGMPLDCLRMYCEFCENEECPDRIAQGKDYAGFGSWHPARFCPKCVERQQSTMSQIYDSRRRRLRAYVRSITQSADRNVA